MDEWWILVGMMGSGKSTVGMLLAERTSRSFRDTDQMVAHMVGHPIPRIMSLYGEAAFRAFETNALRHLARERGVLATGGGIVMAEENWVEMRRLGKTIFLDPPLEVLIARLRRSQRTRPLLVGENWEERLKALLEARRPFYERADVRVPVGDEDHAATVEAILRRVEAAC